MELINVLVNEIYFISGGIEGDNWVLKGMVIEKWEFGNYIIIFVVEYLVVIEIVE